MASSRNMALENSYCVMGCVCGLSYSQLLGRVAVEYQLSTVAASKGVLGHGLNANGHLPAVLDGHVAVLQSRDWVKPKSSLGTGLEGGPIMILLIVGTEPKLSSPWCLCSL